MRILFLFLLFSLSPSTLFAKGFHPTESNQGIYFNDIPQLNREIIVGNTFMQLNDWQKSSQHRLDELMEALTHYPLLAIKENYILVTRVENTIPLPVSQVISPETFANPEYHKRLNPSYKMELIQRNPMVFQTARTSFGIELTTLLTVGMYTGDQLSMDPVLNNLLFSKSINNLPAYAVTVRYSSKFNHLLDRMITITEFYDINGQSTLMNTYLAVAIKKNSVTDGFMSSVFRSKIKSFLVDSAVESLESLYKMLGLQ